VALIVGIIAVKVTFGLTASVRLLVQLPDLV